MFWINSIMSPRTNECCYEETENESNVILNRKLTAYFYVYAYSGY